MRIFCSWKWLKSQTSFKVFKSYVKKIWNAKNFHIFLDDISENCSLCCQGQQSYLCRPGQVHDEIWQFNCVFFPCCMFPNKKYWKKLQILKKNQCFGASVNIPGLFWDITDVLFLKLKLWQTVQVISRRNLTDQLRVFSIVHVSHQKILQKIANFEKNQCFGALLRLKNILLLYMNGYDKHFKSCQSHTINSMASAALNVNLKLCLKLKNLSPKLQKLQWIMYS